MGKIVFCEDDLTIQKLIRVALRATPHQILIASNGTDGLALIERERPHLVCTDVAMPGMDGLHLCSTIRARPDLAHIPVILISASAQRTQIEEGYAQGASDFLAKPFTMAQLREMIDRYAGDR